jgi:hypothetical protein
MLCHGDLKASNIGRMRSSWMLLNLSTYWYAVLDTTTSSHFVTSTVAVHAGEKKTVCRVLVGKPEGKRPCGRSEHRWKDTIISFVKEIGWEGID